MKYLPFVFVVIMSVCAVGYAAFSFGENLYDLDDEKNNEFLRITDQMNLPKGDSVFFFDESTMSNVPDIVLETASSAFQELKEMETGAHFALLSIKGIDEMEGAKLGIPYEVFYIPEEYVEAEETPQNMEFGTMMIWAFPIIIDGQFKALYKIANHNAEWKWVELGASVGARLVQKMEMQEDIVGVAKKRVFVNSYNRSIGFTGYAGINETVEGGKFYSCFDRKFENEIVGIDEVIIATSEFPNADGN